MSSRNTPKGRSKLPPYWRLVDEGLQIVLGELPPPTMEFHAAAVMVEDVSSTPTLWFAQTGPGSKTAVAAVGIAVARDDLARMHAILDPLKKRILEGPGAPKWDKPIDAQFENLPPSAVRTLPASTAAAIVGRFRAMLDFYNVEIFNPEIHDVVTGGSRTPAVTPQIRVYLGPSVLMELLLQIHTLLTELA